MNRPRMDIAERIVLFLKNFMVLIQLSGEPLESRGVTGKYS